MLAPAASGALLLDRAKWRCQLRFRVAQGLNSPVDGKQLVGSLSGELLAPTEVEAVDGHSRAPQP